MLHSLLDKFKKDFAGVKASVLKNVFVLRVCVLQRETVNLNKLKKQVGPVLGNTSSQPVAHYKRLVRLFQQEKESDLWQQLLLFCLRLFRLKVDHLLLDSYQLAVRGAQDPPAGALDGVPGSGHPPVLERSGEAGHQLGGGAQGAFGEGSGAVPATGQGAHR